jgi:hypothetical protein
LGDLILEIKEHAVIKIFESTVEWGKAVIFLVHR